MRVMAIESAQGHDSAAPVERRSHAEIRKPAAFDIPEIQPPDDTAARKSVPARGIVFGVLASAAIWALIAVFVF